MNAALVVVFLVLIAIPGVGLVLWPDEATNSEAEMRALAPPPHLEPTWASIAAFPAALQQYVSDHFALRVTAIETRNAILLRWFRTAPSETVILGRDGTLFYADDGGMEDWVQATPMQAGELEAWRRVLEARRAWLAAQGIPYLFTIAPDKPMIYPEEMPASLHRMREDYRADQLIAYLRVHSDFPVLDLRGPLLAAKHGPEALYHRYDSHWNDRGGLVGYQAIVRALQPWFPAMRPLTRADFDTSPYAASGDKVSMLALRDRGKDHMPGLTLEREPAYRVVYPAVTDTFGEEGRLETEIAGSHLPRAVVFRDSFAGRLIPFLSEHFSRAVYLWQNNVDVDVIRRERPDVVIQEMAARHLCVYYPYMDVPETTTSTVGHGTPTATPTAPR